VTQMFSIAGPEVEMSTVLAVPSTGGGRPPNPLTLTVVNTPELPLKLAELVPVQVACPQGFTPSKLMDTVSAVAVDAHRSVPAIPTAAKSLLLILRLPDYCRAAVGSKP
jgi:hypothetical protein